MKFNRILLIVVSLALMLFALAGCGKDAAQDSQKKLNIVATTTMLTDLVKEIGGDHVSVQGLMGPGVDPHLYQASAGDVTTMSKADVVVYNGIHLEGKMGSIFDNLTKKNKILYLVTLILVVGGDLFTKHLVSSSMLLGQSHEIINNFFYFTYAHNTGVAWGMFAGKLGLFIVVAIIAAVVMIVFFRKTKSEEVLTRFGLVLTFGGMIGNLVDRIFLGYVRDFIDVIIFNYNFPIFNIADMAVVIGVALIIVEIVFEEYIHGKN